MECENGEPFNGFTSGKLTFDIEMYDVLQDASLFVYDISGIKVSNNQDTTGPSIAPVGEIKTSAPKDSVYTINRVVVGDVLSPSTVATLTVKTPNGVVVTDVNGKKLENVDATVDYQINLAEYGTYHVSVLATEESSWKFINKSYYAYVVNVVDGERPTITFESEISL